MKKAIIDIGSNTVRLVIYQLMNNQYKQIITQKKTVGLVYYIEDNQLMPDGLKCLTETLCEFKILLENLKVQKSYYFATEALRSILNQKDIINHLSQELNIQIDILSRQQEGLYDYYGMKQSIDFKAGVLIDIGGGSSEVVHFNQNGIIQNQSFPLGSLSLYKEHVKGIVPTTKELNQIHDHVKKEFKDIDVSHYSKHAIGIGGTLRACILVARTVLKKNNIQDTLTKEEIDYLINQLTQKSRKTTQIILRIKPDRIHTLIPGLIILKELIQNLSIQDLTIAYTGLREGYFIKKTE